MLCNAHSSKRQCIVAPSKFPDMGVCNERQIDSYIFQGTTLAHILGSQNFPRLGALEMHIFMYLRQGTQKDWKP